jgi:hypothetical protein
VATKPEPSRTADPADVEPSTTLLVRRIEPDRLDPVLPLLAVSGIERTELSRLAATRGVVGLSDVALPPTVAPLAALAVDVDTGRRVARIVAIGVAGPRQRQGLGRRLVNGTAILMRATGIERLEAVVPAFGTLAAFLGALGFAPQDGSDDESGLCRFAQWL